MESDRFRPNEKFNSVRPRLKKTVSTLTGLQSKISLPKLQTPRLKFDFINSRKFSVGGLTSRFSHFEPLPPIKIKNKNTERFGQSPILTVECEDDRNDKEIHAFIQQIEKKRHNNQN
jgi:hypothetical protein